MAQIRKSLAKGTSIELWWQDEARVGQQTRLTRRWAKRGTRPSAPRDQRRSSAWIFGAICPAEGKAAGIVMPRCNSEAMSMHLEEIAFHVAPGAHAVVLLDQGRVAWLGRTGRAAQRHPDAAAAQMPGAQPGRERVAVHARQLALEQDLQILRRYRRSLLLRLEQTRRSALAHHVHRPATMGPWVMINESWYNLRQLKASQVIRKPSCHWLLLRA